LLPVAEESETVIIEIYTSWYGRVDFSCLNQGVVKIQAFGLTQEKAMVISLWKLTRGDNHFLCMHITVYSFFVTRH